MKTLRIILSGMFAVISMGFYSNAASDMQAINDQYLSDITGQTAFVSDSADSYAFVNFVEQTMSGHISDETKNSDDYIESLAFLNRLCSDMTESPFAPRLSFIENEDGTSMDLQIGYLKLHFQSIDINGTVSIQKE
jgi:hypothetical protein